MDPVNNIPDENIINRLSPMQLDILNVFPKDDGTRATIMTTGKIIDQIGRNRDGNAYASVSRSLDRLVKLGLLAAWTTQLCRPGRGYIYRLTDEGLRLRGKGKGPG
jgi:DNA-binding MarR family transcriptional regulator